MAASAWNAAPAVARDLLGDERLARLAARGDERAFDTLYARYRPDLERYCRSILRNGADSEDAAQNAMVSALRALESGTIPMRVKPWLYKIAHNEAISLARRRRPDEDLDNHALAAASGPEEASAVRERLGQLMTDLKALTERQREALVLRELFGLTYGEVAQTLGSSEAAAQQTVFEARSAIMAFGEGRAMGCEHVQRAMSDCDGNRLRTRRFRAHVRGCQGCKEFEASLLARRRDLGMLFPPAGGAVGMLAGLARLLGLGGGGERLVAALGFKGAAIGAAVLAGTGALVVATHDGGRSNPADSRVGSPGAGALVASPARSGAAASQAAGAAHGAKTGAGSKTAPHRHGKTKPTEGAQSIPGAKAPANAGAAGDGTGGPTDLASTNGGAGTPAGARDAGGGSAGHGPVPGHSGPANAVNQVAGSVGQTVDNAANQVTSDAGNAVNQVTTTAAGAADQTTTTATGIVKQATGGLGLP